MKYYLASSFHRRDELRTYREILHSLGHVVTSTWLDQIVDLNKIPSLLAIELASTDLHDLNLADELILFTEVNGAGIGHHIEYGYAIAKGKRVTLVGPFRSLFHMLISVHHSNSKKWLDWLINSDQHLITPFNVG